MKRARLAFCASASVRYLRIAAIPCARRERGQWHCEASYSPRVIVCQAFIWIKAQYAVLIDHSLNTPPSPPFSVSPTSPSFESPNAISWHRMNNHHSTPSSSHPVIHAPQLAPPATGRFKGTVRDCPGPMRPSPPPPYNAYYWVPDTTMKPPNGHSNDPPAHTRMAVTERARKSAPKGNNRGMYAGNLKGTIVSRFLNIFRKDRKDDIRDSDSLEWPPRATKYLTDPSLPLRLISPFDPGFRKLKARAKTQEEWEEHRRIQGRVLQPDLSRESRNI